MIKVSITIFLFSLALFGKGIPKGLYTLQDDPKKLLHYHLPYGIDMSHSPLKCDRFLINRAYVSCYNYKTNTVLWSSYTITDAQAGRKGPRYNRFLYDKRLPKRHRVKPSDYSTTGWDRGHLMPNALVNGKDSVTQAQTFLMSNIAPQNPTLNRQGWAALEKAVRKWVHRHQRLNVITGVWFNPNPAYIGKRKQQKIAVPSYWYKIILDSQEHRTMAFWMPNKPITKRQWYRYRTSINQIEKKTGIDFFFRMPDDIQKQIKINNSSRF